MIAQIFALSVRVWACLAWQELHTILAAVVILWMEVQTPQGDDASEQVKATLDLGLTVATWSYNLYLSIRVPSPARKTAKQKQEI